VRIRDIAADEANRILESRDSLGYRSLFNGYSLDGFDGPLSDYMIKDGAIQCRPGRGGTIFTKEEFSDFQVRVEFQLPPGGNNGLAIRYPGTGDTAYDGFCELQVLDNTSERYSALKPYQYHGSAYGLFAAHRGYLRPVGEWNFEEVTVNGSTVKVELNGTVILDADLAHLPAGADPSKHPGVTRRKGSFGFAGHNDPVAFRRVRIRPIEIR
jgi:hypothetical protein